MSEAVSRYGHRGDFFSENSIADDGVVVGWEIWNEPNFQVYWDTGPDSAMYIEMFHRASEAIVELDADAVVLHGGLLPDPNAVPPTEFLEAFSRGEATDCFDVVNLHPYFFTGDAPDNLVSQHIAPARAAGDAIADKPVWLTDFGYATAWEVDETTQAQYV